MQFAIVAQPIAKAAEAVSVCRRDAAALASTHGAVFGKDPHCAAFVELYLLYISLQLLYAQIWFVFRLDLGARLYLDELKRLGRGLREDVYSDYDILELKCSLINCGDVRIGKRPGCGFDRLARV